MVTFSKPKKHARSTPVAASNVSPSAEGLAFGTRSTSTPTARVRGVGGISSNAPSVRATLPNLDDTSPTFSEKSSFLPPAGRGLRQSEPGINIAPPPTANSVLTAPGSTTFASACDGDGFAPTTHPALDCDGATAASMNDGTLRASSGNSSSSSRLPASHDGSSTVIMTDRIGEDTDTAVASTANGILLASSTSSTALPASHDGGNTEIMTDRIGEDTDTSVASSANGILPAPSTSSTALPSSHDDAGTATMPMESGRGRPLSARFRGEFLFSMSSDEDTPSTPSGDDSPLSNRDGGSSASGDQGISSGPDDTLQRTRRNINSDAGNRPLLFPMKRVRKPENWEYVYLVAKDEYRHCDPESLTSAQASHAYCTLCNAALTFSKGQTTSVSLHMRLCHPDKLQEHRAKRQRVVQDPLENIFAPVLPPHQELLEFFTKEEQDVADKMLAEWLAESHRPFSLPGDPGFIKYIRYITQSACGKVCEIPSRAKITTLISELAAQYRESLKHRLVKDRFDNYCVSTDCWSDRAMRSYIGTTMHYISEDFKMHDWTLDVEPLPGKHDGTAIADALQTTFTRWGLNKEDCVRLVRDGAKNGKNAAVKLGVENFTCVAHSLHLVVSGAVIKKRQGTRPSADGETASTVVHQDGVPGDESIVGDDVNTEVALDQMEDEACAEVEDHVARVLVPSQQEPLRWMRNVVQSFRALVVYFKNSAKARNRLVTIRDDVQKGCKEMFQLDCATRWSSTYEMLTHFLTLRLTVEAFFLYLRTPQGRVEFDRCKIVQPTPKQWFAIKCLVRLLEPFAAAVEQLSGSRYPTFALAYPVLRYIRSQLENGDLFEDAIQYSPNANVVATIVPIAHGIRESLLELFDKHFGLVDLAMVWTSYLDPRLTDMDHLDAQEKALARQYALTAAVDCAMKAGSADVPPTPASVSICTPEKAKSKLKAAVFGKRAGRQSVNSSRDAASSQQSTTIRQRCEAAFDAYLKDTSSVSVDEDPLSWWRANHTKHPIFARLARKWLCCVATSVPAERAFSVGGNVVSVKRCGLSPYNVRDAIFIAQNVKLRMDQK